MQNNSLSAKSIAFLSEDVKARLTQIFGFLAIVLLLFIWQGCDKISPPISSPTRQVPHSSVKPLGPGPLTPIFGAMAGLNGHPTEIANYGPSPGQGWRGIFLYSGRWSSDQADLNAANAAGYYPIIGILDRNYILHRQWAEIDAQIAFGKANGVDWFFVDDALSFGDSINTVTGDSVNLIRKGQIDTVAMKVHSGVWYPLATAEYSQTMLQKYPDWHQNVDYIMPYKYWANDATELDAYFSWISTHYSGKSLFPILGYHALINGRYYYQRGDLGNINPEQKGFIEVAAKYSSYIFYYSDPEPGFSNFNTLTTYLQTYYGMGGGL